MIKKVFLMILAGCFTFSLMGKVDGKMLRQPDVSATKITFVYAGDIWTVSKNGGTAVRLSSPTGEESFPRFSPDGKSIAYCANYDGNVEIYTIPVEGGVPKRITWHPSADRVTDWYPDGKSLLFASNRESGRTRFSQFYKISVKGGFAEKLPVPYGEFGTISGDEKTIAYTPKSRDFRNWKRYRGGGVSDIWLFDLKTRKAKNITENNSVDGHPMWHGKYIYFLSDRGNMQRQNIWKYDKRSKKAVQVTKFKNFDVTFPAKGPQDIVFENGGKIYLLSMANDKIKEVNIEIAGDFASMKPKVVKPRRTNDATVSPDGNRLIIEARGELFSVPAKEGFTRNITATTAERELYPSWSPDGKKLVYISDATGEYEYYLRSPKGEGKAKKLTSLGKGLRYRANWAPDSKKFVFIDNMNKMGILNISNGKIEYFDSEDGVSHGALQNFHFSWSHDSNWIAYSKKTSNRQSALFLYDLSKKKTHKVTSGFYNDSEPVFDPAGKYLYFLSARNLRPMNSAIDNTWIYTNATAVYATALRKGTPSVLAPENDEFKPEKKKKKPVADKGKKKKKKSKKKAKKSPLKIDLHGLEYRMVKLTDAGRYGNLAAVKGMVLYLAYPNSGSNSRTSTIMFYSLKKKKAMPVTKGGGFLVTANGKKLLVVNRRRQFHIVNIKPKQKLKKPVSTADMMMTVDPAAEWEQIVTDVWRRYRDFFHDKHMHKVDWAGMKKQYLGLLKSAVTRRDVNVVIGNLIAELNASHTYAGGGDIKYPERQNMGLLGINWEIANGAYRVKKIIKGAPWDNEVRSPLMESGVKVKTGDYILAVNGVKIDTSREPFASFQGLGNKTVELTVNSKPSMTGSRKVIVKTLRSEVRLRNLDWINNNRLMVERLSKGRVGYVYMPNTGSSGLTELLRQYYGQMNKEAFIIDERFNDGGNLPDRFIEMLTRTPGHYIDRRNGTIWRSSDMANGGPKVMLINGWSVSGGDAFPYVFKYRKAGTIVGMRTVGGLIGPTIRHTLMDGGAITVPSGRIFGHDGTWFPEGHGVEPDIKVIDNPEILATGMDPQIKAGVKEALRLLKKKPTPKITIPSPEDRTAKAKK